MEENQKPFCELDLEIEHIRLLYDTVCFKLEKWPGGDPIEQENLGFMKEFLYKVVLEYQFRVQS